MAAPSDKVPHDGWRTRSVKHIRPSGTSRNGKVIVHVPGPQVPLQLVHQDLVPRDRASTVGVKDSAEDIRFLEFFARTSKVH